MGKTLDLHDGAAWAGEAAQQELAELIAERDMLAKELLTPQVFSRLVGWLREPNPRPAVNAFTAGIERQIAYALEMDVLPEVKRLRHRAKLDAERIESLETTLIQVRGEVESWLTDNSSKIEAMENELAVLRNQAVIDAETIRKLKGKQ